jgi:hypothetical protein
MPILAVTTRRSRWSRCADPGGHDGATRALSQPTLDVPHGDLLGSPSEILRRSVQTIRALKRAQLRVATWLASAPAQGRGHHQGPRRGHTPRERHTPEVCWGASIATPAIQARRDRSVQAADLGVPQLSAATIVRCGGPPDAAGAAACTPPTAQWRWHGHGSQPRSSTAATRGACPQSSPSNSGRSVPHLQGRRGRVGKRRREELEIESPQPIVRKTTLCD